MIIGLHGRMRAGKDTVCQMLREIDIGVERIAFADKLKRSAAAVLGITVEHLEKLKTTEGFTFTPFVNRPTYDDEWDEIMEGVSPFSIRTFLQRYGTEAHRDIFGSDFWIREALPDLDPGHFVVVTDVRFPNEIDAIHDRAGVVVHVRRVGTDITTDSHPSEQKIPESKIDYTLDNDESLDDLRNQVALLYEWLCRKDAQIWGERSKTCS